MSHAHNATPPEVPAELVAERRAGWHEFTNMVKINCIGVAVVLVLMLLFLRIL